MTNIKVGDYVHYQPKPTREGFLPMGMRNLKVLGFDKRIDDGKEVHHVICEWEPFQTRWLVPLDCCTKDQATCDIPLTDPALDKAS